MIYCCKVLSVYIRLITEFYSWGKEQFYFCFSLSENYRTNVWIGQGNSLWFLLYYHVLFFTEDF